MYHFLNYDFGQIFGMINWHFGAYANVHNVHKCCASKLWEIFSSNLHDMIVSKKVQKDMDLNGGAVISYFWAHHLVPSVGSSFEFFNFNRRLVLNKASENNLKIKKTVKVYIWSNTLKSNCKKKKNNEKLLCWTFIIHFNWKFCTDPKHLNINEHK